MSSLIFCIAFGLAVIANVNMGGDGDWYWYAKLLRQGYHLYSNLNFTLQPFYVLETAWFQDIFGESWIASKIPALLQLLALSVCMFVLAKKSDWSGRQRAIVLLAAFFFGIRPEWYRFDDYHVLTDFFIIFAAILLLRLENASRAGVTLALVATIGIIAGLTFTTRLNDGAALFCFSALAIAFVARTMRVLLIGTLATFFGITIVVVIALSGDSLPSWATISVLQAGSLKGGNAQFISDPIRVLVTAWTYIWSPEAWAVVEVLAVGASWTYLIEPRFRSKSNSSQVKAVVGSIAIAILLYLLASEIVSGNLLYAVLAVFTFAAYALAAVVIVRAILHLSHAAKVSNWQPREIVLLLPFVMIGSTSLSSGGNFYDLYMPAAVLILLVPILAPFAIRSRMKSAFTAIAVLLAVSGICYKANDPSSWISYRTSPLFVNRQLVDHPTYGPMIMDKTLLRFVTRICSLVEDGDSPVELVSVPWPYANYYCGIPPWHNFVQTWFDTTNRVEVDDLTAELETNPPKWILYQRQLGTLTYHEITYNNGHGLPQRSLDDYVMEKINDGEWRVVLREPYGLDSDWILARTSTHVSHGENLLTDATATAGLSGWRQSTRLPNWSSRSSNGGAIVASTHNGDFTESTIGRDVKFPRQGAVSVSIDIDAAGVNTYVGGIGYLVDLYDQTTDMVVGSLGQSNSNIPLRRYRFDADVNDTDSYSIRLHYGATDGVVAFSNLSIVYRPSTEAIANLATSLDGWTMAIDAPKWSAASDGGFVVTQMGSSSVESELTHAIVFKRRASVVVQARIGADSLVPSGGFGYTVDLFDMTTDTNAGSIGVPARVSPPEPYSFTATVVPSDRYEIRLRFQGSSGAVTYSKLKIEYGTNPTEWSDEASKSMSDALTRKGHQPS